jgi:hypothetical protein
MLVRQRLLASSLAQTVRVCPKLIGAIKRTVNSAVSALIPCMNRQRVMAARSQYLEFTSTFFYQALTRQSKTRN